MTGHHCCMCGNTKAKDPTVTFHGIPKEPEKRALWIKCFDFGRRRQYKHHNIVKFLVACTPNGALFLLFM